MVQLPAVNTPQFNWVLSKLSHEPQPVPPIYQPEVAARAIVFAANHPRRREYSTFHGTQLAARALPPSHRGRRAGHARRRRRVDAAPRGPHHPPRMTTPPGGLTPQQEIRVMEINI